MAQYLDEACVNSRFFMLSNDVLVIDEKYYETQEVWYDEKSRIWNFHLDKENSGKGYTIRKKWG